MAFIFGVATQEADLYKIFRDFITGCGRPGKVVKTGTGNGEMNNLIFPEGGVGMYETFTVTCQSAAPRGGTFGVVGSVSGVLPDAVVGQVYKQPQVEFYLDFGAVDYQVGDQFIITCAAKPVGKPIFSHFTGGPEIKTEVVTLICTSAGVKSVPGSQSYVPALFSVSGSISGGLPDLTQGTLYANSRLRCLLADVPTSDSQYQVGDVITVEMQINPLRQSGQHWSVLRRNQIVDGTTQFGVPKQDVDQELIVVGPGLSGDDSVYYGLTRTWNDGSAAASWSHFALGGYAASMPINEQPLVQGGQSGVRPVHTFWGLAIPYTIIASGRCFKLLTRSNTYYSQSYQGLFLPSTQPKYQGYPYFSGGCGDTRSTFWSALSANRASFWNYTGDGSGSSAWVLQETKAWSAVWGDQTEAGKPGSGANLPTYSHPMAYPQAQRAMFDLRNNLDGSVPLMQVQLTPNLGFLDGVYAIPGRDGRAPEEIVVNRDGSRMLVVQNHHRAGFNDFAAFTLE